MGEVYKDKEWALRGAIESLSNIPDYFEMYIDEVDKYINALTNSSIKESRELYLLTQRYEATQKEIGELIGENTHLREALESIYNASINLIRSIDNDYIKIIIPKKEPQAYFVDSICCPEILDYDEVNISIKEDLKKDLINNMNYYKEKYNLKENTKGE